MVRIPKNINMITCSKCGGLAGYCGHCGCGCGETPKCRDRMFYGGHYMKVFPYIRTAATRKKNGDANRGRVFPKGVLGVKKGNVPWNKGLTKEDERVARNSVYSWGHPRAEPVWNKNLTKETDERVLKGTEKMMLNHSHCKPWLGKKRSAEDRLKMSIGHIGQEVSEEQRKVMSINSKERWEDPIYKKIVGDKISVTVFSQWENNTIRREEQSDRMKNMVSDPIFKREQSERMLQNWKNPVYREKSRKAMSVSAKKRCMLQFSDGTGAGIYFDTKPEVSMKKSLEDLEINYIHPYWVNIEHDYIADFYLPGHNLIIEVDGKYWHKYPEGKEIDHIRTQELKEAGYKVLRFWENEFNTQTVKEKIFLEV